MTETSPISFPPSDAGAMGLRHPGAGPPV